MKKILSLLLVSFTLSAQDVYQESGSIRFHTQNKGGIGAERSFLLPLGTHDSIFPTMRYKGRFQYNSSTNKLEYNNNSSWKYLADEIWVQNNFFPIPSGLATQYLRGDGTTANFPTIPSAQVQSDWNSLSGLGVVLNKPIIPTNTNQLTNGAGFITGYTETDPNVPTYSKSLTAFSIIKASTDPLYKAIGYSPTSLEITTALGVTPISQAQARASITLTTTGSGQATYNNSTGVLNIPTPSIPIPDYTNTVAVAGGVGNSVFYLTSDKTSTGTALYTNITCVLPIINDSTVNYTYGWTYNSTTKALTVNAKSSAGINVALVGLTLLGLPSPVANGTNIQILVKGN